MNLPSSSQALRRVAIVGAGLVSPLGFGLRETLDALRAGRDCVSGVDSFSVAQTRCQTAGQVSNNRLLASHLRDRRSARLHRVSHMLIAALDELLTQAPGFEPELTVVGTTSGGMSFGENFFRHANARHSAEWVANYTPQKQMGDAQERCGIRAPMQVIANACASGANAIGHAFDSIRSGRYSRVLAGGYDGISELVFVGFDSLQAATPDKCRPFDATRNGMVLGEGAALLALEEFESAEARGANITGEIVGYGISTDNHHLTQPNPDGSGPRAAMQNALDSAGMAASEVDYINAHGTATHFNDASEGLAISQLFDNVPVSSTKGMMGHSLGAAGAIETVIAMLALQHGLLPPNINFATPDPELPVNIVANISRRADLKVAMSNSFGFGGTNASVIVRKFGA